MTTTIALYNSLRRPVLDLFIAPFRPRTRGLLDRRSLSDHFLRDIGMLDGRVPPGGSR
ncbi:hypothetical protein [Mesorhizobium sp. 131-2-1]|uniref:hypothetical protein n=1 Tax=Mesorhizobium sp. 131-2-1 TaxID=2744518 RepID=UPI00192743D4|nr:hypothetical protein [Mesorhizobium sp. 131-2-1]BCG94905.1 hypothetical protein MesoLj131a_37690 [Mesorhizobium sp. 131-2-1]